MGLYERIKEVAKSKGYSINKLEKELGFARSSISKFNKNVPSMEKVKQIADFLDVPITDITGESKESNTAQIIKSTTNRDINLGFSFADRIFKEVLREMLEKKEMEEFTQRVNERLPKDFGKEQITFAAHFDGNEFTEDELEEIRRFAEFVKAKRK